MRGPTQVRSSNHPPRDRSTARPASGHDLPLRNIQELPPEILAESLLRSMTDDEIFGLRRQRELASVCRKWRDVVLPTPQFWNAVTDNAEVGDPLLIVPIKLRRFKDTLLTVKYTDASADPESGVWNLLQSATSRWKEATLTLGSSNHGKLSSTLKQGMPNLSRLTLLSNVNFSTRIVGLGPTPRLEELCLSRVSLYFIRGATLSTLRRLTVNIIDSEFSLNAIFLPTLAGCPLLEFLHVAGITLYSPEPFAHGADLNVTLPFLKILELEDVPVSLASLLLRHLRADGLEQLRVVCVDDGYAMAVLPAMSEPRHGSNPILSVLSCRDTTEVRLSIGGHGLQIKDKAGRLTLDFLLNDQDVYHLADILRPVYHCCTASARKIGMVVYLYRAMSLESLHFLCEAAPMVTRIHCYDPEQYGQLWQCVLNAISRNACPICSPGGRTRSNTFSRLSELRIYAKDGSIPSPECIRAVHVAYLSRQRIVQGKAASSGDDPLEDLPDLKIFIDDKFVAPDLGSLDQDS